MKLDNADIFPTTEQLPEATSTAAADTEVPRTYNFGFIVRAVVGTHTSPATTVRCWKLTKN